MTKKHSLRVVLMAIAAIVALSVSLCHILSAHRSKRTTVIIDTIGLRNGDLLFRKGYGGESQLVTRLSNGIYSHIAMAYKADGKWMAVHAVPGETEHRTDTDYLKSEPLELFYCPERAQNGGTARVRCSDSTALQALTFALDKVQRRFSFDHNYRLNDSTRYYCTELVYRAYLAQGIDLADDRRIIVPMPNYGNEYIMPSDILASPHIEDYKQLKTIVSTN